MPTDSTTSSTSKVLLGCSKCGASLPGEAQFCLKCGKSVSSPPKKVKVVEAQPLALPRQEMPKGRLFLLMLLVILIGLICWALTSDSVGAQGLQELVGFKQDGIILDSSFTVGPHTFRYYKFALPEGSVNVTVVGQFKSTADSAAQGTRKNQTSDKSGDKNRTGIRGKDADIDNNVDNNIEVYVLTDSAFAVWQNGYATSSLYESGRVADGTLQTDIPAGAGVYYLVFSNKAAPKTAKALHANVLLHYKSWLPDWLRRMKGRFWDWVGA
jgi:hypothetical protein